MHKNHCQYYFSILSLLSLLIITSLCNLSFLPISFVDAVTPPLTPTNFDLLLALTSSASYSTTWTPSVAVPSNIVFRTDSKSAPDFTSQGANFIPTRKIDPKMTAATSVSESTGVAAASFANPSTTFSFHSFVSFSVDNLPVTNQGLSPIIGKSCYNSKRKTLTSQYLFGLQKIARKTYRVCIDMYSTSISSANEAADAFICTPTITAPDDSITTYTAISIGYNSSLVVFYVNGVRYTVTPAPSATVTTTIVWPLMLGAIPTCDSGPTSTKDRSDCVNGNSLSDCSVENSRPNIYTASHTLRELYFVNGVFTENSLKYMQCYFSRTSNSQQSWCPPGIMSNQRQN